MTTQDVRISKLLSHALRHEPWLYELELDDEGWVPLDQLMSAVRSSSDEWSGLDRPAVERAIASSEKRRHEIDGNRIRALYGHSVPGRSKKVVGTPPAVLFHGTSPEAAAAIAVDGLRPMGRQYVHLSVDVEMATQVARRKAKDAVILRIDTTSASTAGVAFWVGNEAVWLAEYVPSTYVSQDSDS